MTASPGIANYQHDVLGNRTWRNYNVNSSLVAKHTWDELNRMRSVQGSADGAAYTYRADGMRVRKIGGLSIGFNMDDEGVVSGYYDQLSINRPTTRYYYDGQMPISEDHTYKNGSNHTVMEQTWHGVGARGVDYQSSQTLNKSTNVWGIKTEGYPVYDTHGNNVGMYQWNGTAYSVGNERTYDAWGAVRTSSGSPPQQGYCANLGHRVDNESSLVYMRARYYEPGTGRFLSQDRFQDGTNWYGYCANDPINFTDSSGNAMDPVLGGGCLAMALYFLVKFYGGDTQDAGRAIRFFVATLAAIGLTATAKAAESWIFRAAERIAAVLRLDGIQRPDQFFAKLSRNDARIAFYTGYAIFLVFAMAELEAWANGEIP